jgi:magnesium transporter
MIRIYYRHVSGTLVKDFPKQQLSAALRDGSASLWVDLLDPTEEEYREILTQIFQFHPLAVEDAAQSLLIPKLDDYRRYLFLVIHTVHPGQTPLEMESSEMDIFLGVNFLVTIHEQRLESVEHFWADTSLHEAEGLSRGAAMLLYDLLSLQMERLGRLLDNFERELEDLSGEILLGRQFSNQRLAHLLTANNSALRLNRVLRPQRDVMQKLAGSEYGPIPSSARLYFADIYDHLARTAGLVESMREMVRNTLDIHMALANNRMNEIIKVLTIISTIFMPLSFLAAVYGMNFDYMPELGWAWAYPLIWLIFLGVAFGLLRLFRERGWL